ncbi:hypothetical protein [Escherichia coli]|uniref:hypothetical protein n=1 Tax=Escherichia coli TaxID=562 RepID=UPI0015937D51|nr:hypothetical protein [Escherichia coli]
MDETIIASIAATCAGLAGVIVSKWLPQKGSTEDAMIGRLMGRLDDVEGRVEVLEARERSLLGYVSVLRFHIDSGKGPPAPDWPEGLLK